MESSSQVTPAHALHLFWVIVKQLVNLEKSLPAYEEEKNMQVAPTVRQEIYKNYQAK
jgi:hypothetical protein